MIKNIIFMSLALVSMLAACGPVPHPFADHPASNPLIDDRRVTSSVQIMPVAEYPGLDEMIVHDLARQDVLASTHDPGPRKVLVKGTIENGALVWRAVTQEQTELGVVKQPVPIGNDIPRIAREATPLIVGLLTANGAAPDTTRPHVVVHLVHGPKDIQTKALSLAMADALASQGLAIADDNPVAMIDGELRILPGTGSQDVVQIDWTVRDAKGKAVGTVSQGSPIDHKLLGTAFPGLAHDIAAAGAPGIVDVIRRKLPTALGGTS
ncbi:MAG TPA: hypothetical protein VGG27_16255 [Magnetospirillaceae bacterium]|jgi:hypothetical protein